MINEKITRTALIWIPSVVLSWIFIQNGIGKIVHSDQTDKIVTNSSVMIITGVFLLIATALFLYNKTILIGTILLVLYMIFIVIIHIDKGKPFEIAVLIVMSIIFSAYLRKPQLFSKEI